MGSIRRGRILRDTAVSDGLVFVDGKQYPFRLEGTWKSEFAPKVNMLVDAEFDDQGQLVAVRTASAEAVAAARTAQACNVAKATTRTIARDVRSDALPAVAQQAQAIGYPTLAAAVALLLGWFYFSVASVDIGAGGRLAVTFYQVLRFLNVHSIQDLMGVGGGAGIWGLMCFLCCGGVALPWLWHDRRASYGMVAPLVFMVLVGILVRHKLSSQLSGFEQAASQFGSFGDAHTRQAAAQFASNAVTEFRHRLSLDFGVWLSSAASLFLAWRGMRQVTRDGADAEDVD